MKGKSIMHLEDDVGEYLPDIGVGNCFKNITQKH